MPQGFVDDFEGKICDEKFHECTLWNDILSTDLDGEEVLLLNIRDYGNLLTFRRPFIRKAYRFRDTLFV